MRRVVAVSLICVVQFGIVWTIIAQLLELSETAGVLGGMIAGGIGAFVGLEISHRLGYWT